MLIGCKDQGTSSTSRSIRLCSSTFERFSLTVVQPPQGRLRLWWHSDQLMREVVPPDVLFALLPMHHLARQVRVFPGVAYAPESSSTGEVPPVIAAGEPVSILTEMRDMYGTITDDRSTIVAVTGKHLSGGARSTNAMAARTNRGEHTAHLVVHTRSGLVAVSSSLVHCSGVHATYFNGADLHPTSAVKATLLADIDFSALSFGTPPASSLTTSSQYSIRWSGMLRPHYAHTYTVKASRQSAEERIKVWVDNELLIDSWSSLGSWRNVTGTIAFGKAEGSVYQVVVEYQSPTAGRQGIVLQSISFQYQYITGE